MLIRLASTLVSMVGLLGKKYAKDQERRLTMDLTKF